jgi:hypothetical protein
VRLVLFADFFFLCAVLCRLLFNPLVQWWRKGPIAHQIHRFMWSGAPMHYKISMMACECGPCPPCLRPSLTMLVLLRRYVFLLCAVLARWRLA